MPQIRRDSLRGVAPRRWIFGVTGSLAFFSLLFHDVCIARCLALSASPVIERRESHAGSAHYRQQKDLVQLALPRMAGRALDTQEEVEIFLRPLRDSCESIHIRQGDLDNYAMIRDSNLRLSGGGLPVVVSAHGRADGGEDDVQVSSFRLAQRAAVLALVFGLPVLTAPMAFLLTPFREIFWYRLLAFSLGRSGAAFIKWGQWA